MTARGWLALMTMLVVVCIPPALFLLFGVTLDDVVITIGGSVGVLTGYVAGQLMWMSRQDYLDRKRP